MLGETARALRRRRRRAAAAQLESSSAWLSWSAASANGADMIPAGEASGVSTRFDAMRWRAGGAPHSSVATLVIVRTAWAKACSGAATMSSPARMARKPRPKRCAARTIGMMRRRVQSRTRRPMRA